MLRTAQLLPLTRAFDTALRRRTFPPDAGSLLPGPPGGYPDRTHTGWQRRASNRVRSRHHATPLELQGILQHPAEIGIVVGCVREQRHRRAHLQVVRPAEDLVDRAAVDRRDQPRAFPQPRAEHVVRQICPRLVQRRNPIVLRSGTVAQPPKLRKYEPDPVATLPSAA